MSTANKKTEHTPLPWSISGESIVKGGNICIAVVESDGGYEAPENEQTANLEFICRAVNCHDELVEALKLFLLVEETTKPGAPLRDTAVNNAKSALLKAQKGGK